MLNRPPEPRSSLFWRLLRPAPSRALLVLVALLWSGFCLALDHAGHAPTRSPIPGLRWYRVQAMILPAVLLGMGEVASVLAQWRLRRAGIEPTPASSSALRIALGLPLLCFVVGDALAWRAVGFSGLGSYSAALGGIAVLTMLLVATRLLQRVHQLTAPRALTIAAPALIIAGVCGSLALR